MTVLDLSFKKEIIIISLVYILSFIGLTIFLLHFFPKFTLHFSFLGINVLTILTIFMSNNPVFIVLSGICSILSILFYIFFAYRYIAPTAVLIKDSLSILMKHFFQVFAVIFSGILLFVVNSVFSLLLLEYSKDDVSAPLQIIAILHYFWTMFNSMYFLAVFVSSITAFYVLDSGRSQGTFLKSLKNTVFALGSICLGALLIALIKTLQHLVRGTERKSNKEEKPSLVAVILQTIALLILYFLEDMIRTMNDWIFPYLAIHGKSYKESLYSSFRIVSQKNNSMLIANYCINTAIFFLGFLGILALVFSVAIFIPIEDLLILHVGPDNSHFYEPKPATTIALMFVIYTTLNFLETFSSISKSIMFLYAECPEKVENTLPKSGEVLRKSIYN